MSNNIKSSPRVRVILAVEHDTSEDVRVDIGESLEAVGWIPASDGYDCWLCRAHIDEIEKIERRVRKIFEFAAFTAGFEGRMTFALKLGELAPRTCTVRVGSGGLKTKVLPARVNGMDFATERVPNGGANRLPRLRDMPDLTHCKTAF